MPRFGPVWPSQLSKVARTEWDRVIAAVAERQYGVIIRAQLLAIGLSGSAITQRVRARRLHTIERGVFAVGFRVTGPRPRWMAAVLVCGPEALLSNASAAALWRIRPTSAARIDITSPARSGRERDWIRAHSAGDLLPSHCTEVDGIPCTTIARTIVDLAGHLSRSALEYTIHRAQVSGQFDRDEVLAVLASTPTRRGSKVLRELLGITPAPEDREQRQRAQVPEDLPRRRIAGVGGQHVDRRSRRARIRGRFLLA